MQMSFFNIPKNSKKCINCGFSTINYMEVVHGVGHPAAEAFQQLLRRGDDVTRLGAPEAAGLDVGAYLVHVGAGEVLQRRVTGKEGGGDEVHPCVGALSRQTDGEQQLVVLAVVQRAGGVGVEFF